MLPAYGNAGWLDDDEAVLLYDAFDIWRVSPDGSGGDRLTAGAEAEIVYRRQNLGAGQSTINPNEPMYMSVTGKWTKERGYARLERNGTITPLIMKPAAVSGIAKAETADVFLFRENTAIDSPDLFVTDATFANPKQISATNVFQDNYAWHHSELIDFVSEAGVRLQAALRYPANYDSSRQYPMIVYTYEILSNGLHSYTTASETSYYNQMVWQQEGYFVLNPDIVYTPREPGVSALQAVRPAVEKIVEMGLVDAARVGLIGHSWGGYQAAYIPTRTNMFAASVAGAGLTDFVSMMGAIHWSSGLPESSHWETGQARMEVPFWEDEEAHRRNSPIHKVQDLETPMLMMYGDDDGTVDYDQGTEFYNFARRAEKQMVLLVYEGEGHSLRQEKNQKDYQRRILEWFGHYLKDDTAPKWITDGIPASEHDAERERVAAGRGGG